MADEYIRKEFAGGAPATTVPGSLTSGATSIVIASGTSQPTGSVGKFVMVINRGLADEEKILVTSRTTTTLNSVQRGYDGTSAQAHTAGATIQHCIDAYTLDQTNAMSNAMTAQYDLVMRGASAGAYSRIAVGANGQVLMVSSGIPSFQTVSTSTLPDGTVTTAKIADAAVTTAKLDDLAVTAAKLIAAIPRGVMGYATATANQTGISTSTDLTGLTVTFTAEAGRRYRITSHARLRQQTTAGYASLRIHNGSGTEQQVWQAYIVPTAVNTGNPSIVVAPGAGSQTYKLNLATNVGTCDVEASATAPSYILVEDIGST